ncbi:hypothetical protein ACFYT4_07445 [Streptomyces sp. NPDC004609]|uniref:hypothetical protein n=1 Tax=Streptomyces sp. NPDC004609 TaxID=3364704 RepID=UPI0036C11E90
MNQWLNGNLPKEESRPLILEALARKLQRPITPTAGFPAPSGESNSYPSTLEGILNLSRQEMDRSRRGIAGAGLFSIALSVPHWPDVVGQM